MNRREWLSTVPIAIGMAATPAFVTASTVGVNVLTIGRGGDFPALDAALAVAGTSASAETPYLLWLLPGIHRVEDGRNHLPAWVALQGSGQEITTLAFSGSAYLTVSSNSKIANLSIAGTRDPGVSRGLISASQRVFDFYLDQVTIYLTGGRGVAIQQPPSYNYTWYWSDVNIFTTSVGAQLRGYQYLRNVNIFLSGSDTRTPYIGLFVPGTCRLYAWNLKCGTGYGSTNRLGFGPHLEVLSDPLSDVIGIHIPASNTGIPRLELHGFESYCRNDTAVDPSVRINCVRVEAGIVRMFGCFTQAESPAKWSLGKDIAVVKPGIAEIYAGRYTTSEGDLSGRNQQAVAYKTRAHDGQVLGGFGATAEPASMFFCDASAGSFSLKLPSDWAGGQPPYMMWTFIKTDTTTNTVTVIAGNWGSISGEPHVSLSTPYERFQIVHDAAASRKWYRV